MSAAANSEPDLRLARLRRLITSASSQNGDGNRRIYEYWLAHRREREGAGPLPRDIAAACGTKLDAAREAVRRYKRGRVPAEYSSGLSVKSVRNVHVVVQLAFKDAVRWDYLHANPAIHAVLPRERAGALPIRSTRSGRHNS